MSHANKWAKLWNTALTDPDMDNLSIENFGRWTKLLLYTKTHGEKGILKIVEPAKSFCLSMQVSSLKEFIEIAEKLPNITVFCNGDNFVTNFVFKNWYKYQIDDSKERVEKYRETQKSVTIQEKEKEKEKDKRKSKSKNEENSSQNFIEEIKKNPAYKGINIDRELAKMDAWFLTPKGKGRKKTKGFIVNWLNKIDVQLDLKGAHEETVADRYKSI